MAGSALLERAVGFFRQLVTWPAEACWLKAPSLAGRGGRRPGEKDAATCSDRDADKLRIEGEQARVGGAGSKVQGVCKVKPAQISVLSTVSLPQRFVPALGAAAKHLAISISVALLVAALVFGLWYPYPYRSISGGRELFTLLMSVDVVAGPLLTLFVFNPRKPRRESWRDLGVIVALQLAALGYGLYSVHQARPVFLAFEGNRFRAISAAELDPTELHEAAGDLATLSHAGPRLIGVRLAKAGDADYLKSIKQSLEGFHPALRPARWVPFEAQCKEAASEARALAVLRARKPDQVAEIDAAIKDAGLPIERLGFLPLQSRTNSEWVVIIDKATGWPKAFAAIDGW